VNTIAASIGEEAETIEEVYEPYLIQLGFLHRSSRGRMATEGLMNISRSPAGSAEWVASRSCFDARRLFISVWGLISASVR